MNAGLQAAQLVLAILLIAAVLIQVRNSGLGSSLGGSDTSFFRARRGIDRLLFNLTIAIAVLFFVVAALIVRV
ncbi:MAG: preprotein translocase subunit SecG [Actinobacteria bacterium]|nr:preprotein translocase subunit SecG [Actinomycetota bacterium]